MTALIDDADFRFVDAPQFDKVVFGLLADGNDAIGHAAAEQVFGFVEFAVDERIEFGMADENEVVHGHHRVDARFLDADG